jgi:hypothetical protein
MSSPIVVRITTILKYVEKFGGVGVINSYKKGREAIPAF